MNKSGFRVVVEAPINIALIKYWGKRNEELILPMNDSISVSVNDLTAYSTITIGPEVVCDMVTVNGKLMEMGEKSRFQRVFKEVRALLAQKTGSVSDDGDSTLGIHSICSNWYIEVESRTNFPVAAGLASSAAGFSAIAVGFGRILNLPEEAVVRLARIGSGSACRSIQKGFVQWYSGSNMDNDSDCYCEVIVGDTHWPEMRAMIIVLNNAQKEIGSSEGMRRSAETSTLIKDRKIVAFRRTRGMRKAIREKNFEELARLTMMDSDNLHAICEDTKPPLKYLSEDSRKIIEFVKRFNKFIGVKKLAYTFDAGPNCCLFFEEPTLVQFLPFFCKNFNFNHLLLPNFRKSEMSTDADACILETTLSLGNKQLSVADCEFFFEGAEKLLEIWFYNDDTPPPEMFEEDDVDKPAIGSLRKIPRKELVKMLETARCHILHARSNSYMDSYVLSESSMFISDRRLILKTCGTTDLLSTIPIILDLAKKYSNLYNVANVYFSRKNFLRPLLQPFNHQGFDNEVHHLDNHFHDGGAYCMGSIKHDRWYLYTMNNPQLPPTCADHSLEILMSDIPQDILNIYSKAECKDGEECTKRGGIGELIPPNTLTHEELFEPHGYSMNGLIPDSDQYVTIHITPEPEFSFVSFETNQRQQCLYKQTLKVLDCFKPNRIILIVFSNDLSTNGKETQMRIWQNEIPGYKRVNLQILRLQHDTLVYAQFNRVKEDGPSYRKICRRIASYNYDDEDSNQSD